jgi:small subunit ribosomal protein S2
MVDQTELTQKMIDAGAHIGVRRFLVHPTMRRFIFTYKEDLALINIAKTVELWENLFKELELLVKAKKSILSLGTQPAAKKLLSSCGEECGFPYMTRRWLGGTLTNFATFKGRLDHLKELQAKVNSQDFAKYTKKEQGQISQEINEIKEKFDGLTKLAALPDALLVFCGRKHRTAIAEAKRMNIPVFGIFGLDDNYDDAAHCVVVNDNAQSVLSLVLNQIRDLYNQSKEADSPAESEKTAAPPPAEK